MKVHNRQWKHASSPAGGIDGPPAMLPLMGLNWVFTGAWGCGGLFLFGVSDCAIVLGGNCPMGGCCPWRLLRLRPSLSKRKRNRYQVSINRAWTGKAVKESRTRSRMQFAAGWRKAKDDRVSDQQAQQRSNSNHKLQKKILGADQKQVIEPNEFVEGSKKNTVGWNSGNL